MSCLVYHNTINREYLAYFETKKLIKKRDIMPFLNAHAIIFFKNEQLLRHTFHRQTDGGLKEVKKKLGNIFFGGKTVLFKVWTF